MRRKLLRKGRDYGGEQKWYEKLEGKWRQPKSELRWLYRFAEAQVEEFMCVKSQMKMCQRNQEVL